MTADANEGRIAWRDPETGLNALSDDFDIDEDAHDPERFRELWDEEPTASIMQPDGAMFDFVVYGPPGARTGGERR